MKKNVMMRLASFLLVAVLISTSAISGTYAKYTTQDSGADEARVAKWGVELQVIGNLYGDTYKDGIVKQATDIGENIRVQSVDETADVVAPGTQNAEGFTFSLKGQPEVDGVVTSTMTIQNVFLKAGTYGVMIPVDGSVVNENNFAEFTGQLYQNNGTDDAPEFVQATAFAASTTYYTLEDEAKDITTYYPVVYALTGNTSSTSNINNDSLKVAADKIATQLGLTAGTPAADTSITYTGTPKAFDANTDLAGWKLDGETLTWSWEFGDEDKVGDGANWTDKADTILGMLENTTEGTVVKLDGTSYVKLEEYKDYCLETRFEIDITVTQVD